MPLIKMFGVEAIGLSVFWLEEASVELLLDDWFIVDDKHSLQ